MSTIPPGVAQFDYTVDARGNRTQAVETILQPDDSTDVHTIDYIYDALSRLLQAQYQNGGGVFRQYDYEYDLAGNRTKRVETIGGSPTTTRKSDTYNAANQLVNDGTNTLTYDHNGNLTSDGTNSYTWDRANRLLSMGGASYAYDGVGRRVSQTVSSIVTEYLLDVQPGLAVVLAASTPGETTRFVHSPRGLERQQQDSGAWLFPVGDGLGSVRGMLDNDWPSADVQGTRQYAPYGVPFGAEGTVGTPFGFTGEQVDGNDLVYLRARYYAPGLGVFASADPVDGEVGRAMSLNGYGWVEGNVTNVTDPTGFQSAATICWTIAGTSPTIGEEAICLGLTFWELFKAITPATSIYTPDVVSRFVTSQTIRYSDIPASSAALGYFSTLPQGTTFAEGLSGYFIAECGNLTDPSQRQDCVITAVNRFLGELGLEDEEISSLQPDESGNYVVGGVEVAGDILLEHMEQLSQELSGGACSPGFEWVLDALSRPDAIPWGQPIESTEERDRSETWPIPLTQEGCLPCPEPSRPCRVDRVPYSRKEERCDGDHFHWYVMDQAPDCRCFIREMDPVCLPQDGFPPPPPYPPCNTFRENWGPGRTGR